MGFFPSQPLYPIKVEVVQGASNTPAQARVVAAADRMLVNSIVDSTLEVLEEVDTDGK